MVQKYAHVVLSCKSLAEGRRLTPLLSEYQALWEKRGGILVPPASGGACRPGMSASVCAPTRVAH